MVYDAFNASKWGPQNNKRLEEWKKFKQQKAEETGSSERSLLKRKMLFLIGR